MAKRFLVTVERMLHVSGTIEVKAKNEDDAESIVRRMLDDVANPLQTTDQKRARRKPPALAVGIGGRNFEKGLD